MTLNIGAVITAKRKEKSWTQEQLANAVGVSTPAVSKWETGTTYPDITLLSPIARALNTTVDELLSYQNELSLDTVKLFAKKVASIYESEGFDAGWAYCQSLIKEYPNSIPLKFYTGNLFQTFMLMKKDMKKEEIAGYYRQAASTYEEVLASGQADFTYHTIIILVGFYTMLQKLDRAEELLNRLPQVETDPRFFHASISALRGKEVEAIALTQQGIRRSMYFVNLGLNTLCSFARDKQDIKTAYTLSNLNLEVTNLFKIYKEIAYPNVIKTCIESGDKKQALDYLEAYAEYVQNLHYDFSNNPVFDKLTQSQPEPSYSRKILAQSILSDTEYFALKDNPRFNNVLETLNAIVQTPTSSFTE